MAHPLAVRPDRDAFDRLAASWPLVPVWAELLADVATPVSVFPALAGDGPGILLESVERSERWGRYSFVAGDPAAILVVDAAGLHLREVARDDLPVLFEHQLDDDASRMAAFPSRDEDAFMAHWIKILGDPTVLARTVSAPSTGASGSAVTSPASRLIVPRPQA